MVRTFLVALRASTAIAVQICANLLSVGLSCVRALVKLPKARHVLEAAAKDDFCISRSLDQPLDCYLCFADEKAELASCKTLANTASSFVAVAGASHTKRYAVWTRPN